MDKLSKPTVNYTVVSNEIFSMTNISAEARFTWCYLFSKPDGWNVNMKDIQRMLGVGRDKSYSVRAELIDAGLLSYQRLLSGGGTYTLHEITTSGKSESGISESGKPAPIVNTERAVNTEKNLMVKTAFDRWWSVWPKKVAKEAALKAFRAAVNKKSAEKIESFTDRIIADTKNRLAKHGPWIKDDGQFIPNPATYLSGKRFNDSILVAKQQELVPRDNDDMLVFATERGMRDPHPGESWYEYRRYVTDKVNS